MKYKTLCRLVVKLFGIWSILNGLTYFGPVIWEWINSEDIDWNYSVGYGAGDIVVGMVTLFLNRWITDRLIPSNRPYCHECGYDLTGAVGNICSECGVEFKPRIAQPEPNH